MGQLMSHLLEDTRIVGYNIYLFEDRKVPRAFNDSLIGHTKVAKKRDALPQLPGSIFCGFIIF